MQFWQCKQNRSCNSTFTKGIEIAISTVHVESKLQFHIYKKNRNCNSDSVSGIEIAISHLQRESKLQFRQCKWNRNCNSTFIKEIEISFWEIEILIQLLNVNLRFPYSTYIVHKFYFFLCVWVLRFKLFFNMFWVF